MYAWGPPATDSISVDVGWVLVDGVGYVLPAAAVDGCKVLAELVVDLNDRVISAMQVLAKRLETWTHPTCGLSAATHGIHGWHAGMAGIGLDDRSMARHLQQ